MGLKLEEFDTLSYQFETNFHSVVDREVTRVVFSASADLFETKYS